MDATSTEADERCEARIQQAHGKAEPNQSAKEAERAVTQGGTEHSPQVSHGHDLTDTEASDTHSEHQGLPTEADHFVQIQHGASISRFCSIKHFADDQMFLTFKQLEQHLVAAAGQTKRLQGFDGFPLFSEVSDGMSLVLLKSFSLPNITISSKLHF